MTEERWATEQKADTWKTLPNGTRVHTGFVINRSAVCAGKDHPPTTDFLGVTADGWVFRCRGQRGLPESRHTFVVPLDKCRSAARS